MLQPGKARPRPPVGKAQAHPGVHPLSSYSDNHFEPLPTPIGQPPYHLDLETVVPGIGAAAARLGKLVFHTVGDTGGIKNGDFQAAVASQMKTDLTSPEDVRPQFFYHLGDVVYYNGQVEDYTASFMSLTITTIRRSSPFPAITTEIRSQDKHHSTAGYATS